MADTIQEFDDTNFAQNIAKKGLVLVDFSAEWCGPCRMLSPILAALAQEMHEKVAVAKLDVDHAPKTSATFQITSVPTLILFKDGKEVSRVIGLKDLESLKKIVSSFA